MKYRHAFRVHAPPDKVAQFHSCSDSLRAITPPPILVQVHRAPERMGGGDEMDLTMWLGPLPVHWVARVEDPSATGFVDRQATGPFKIWTHRHTFVALDGETTEVIDQVDVQCRVHPLWTLVGLGMWLGLPVLFAYRGWKTRKMIGAPRDLSDGRVLDAS